MARRKFNKEKENFQDIGKFLISLKMNCNFEKLDRKHLKRIEQMQLKTNQFNLSTARYNAHDLEEKINLENIHIYVIRLKDKFADHGFISYIEYHIISNSINIQDWLISCRVFSRSLEAFILRTICQLVESREIKFINIFYRETPKNGLMRKIFKELGFEVLKTDGKEVWSNSLEKVMNLKTYIS